MSEISSDLVVYNLEKIYCGGRIPQVAMNADMSLSAISDCGSVIVQWDGLNQDVFDNRIGINDLGLLKNILSQIEKYADVFVSENRLGVIDLEGRTSSRLILGHPDQVITQIEEDHMDKFNSYLDDFPYQEIPSEVFETIKRTIGIMRSESLTLEVRTDGCSFVIGDGTEDIGRVRIPELLGEEDFDLKLPSNTFRDILGVLNKDGEVKIKLTEPSSIIELRQGSVRWIVNPIS